MIEDMTTREKSVLLARAMGWEVQDSVQPGVSKFRVPDDNWVSWYYDLYPTNRMALAWRVLKWACLHDGLIRYRRGTIDWLDFGPLQRLPPAEAQAAWLDMILELAIEAGLVAPAA